MIGKESQATSLILVVEDELPVASMIRQVLEHEHYFVMSAQNGLEALKVIAQNPPDLILMDVNMPQMDGYQACREIKKEDTTKHIPVLMLTVLDSNEERIKGLDMGADDFIHKPFNPLELLARVRAFLRTKRLRDELEQNFIRLKELENLRDNLISMIVHDLKSPINVICSAIDMLCEDITAGRVSDQDIKIIKISKDSCRQMLDLIQDMLDVSRLEQGQFPLIKTRADLRSIVSKCFEILEPVREKRNFTFNSYFDEGIQELMLDENMVQRIIINLLSNSIKFSPDGGTINIFLKQSLSDKQVECVVEDSGKGIPEKYLAKIFDKFFQGDGQAMSKSGHGLGLAFCKMAVEAHGGKIRAEIREHGGSRFIFTIPIIQS